MGRIEGLEVYTRLGVRPVINAQGNRTVLGGSIPGMEVEAAMNQAGVVTSRCKTCWTGPASSSLNSLMWRQLT